MHVEAVHTSGFLLANPLREVLGFPLLRQEDMAFDSCSLFLSGCDWVQSGNIASCGKKPLIPPTAVIFLSYPVRSH